MAEEKHKGQELKKIIEDSGIPYSVLSRKTGLSRPTIYRYCENPYLDDFKYNRIIDAIKVKTDPINYEIEYHILKSKYDELLREKQMLIERIVQLTGTDSGQI